MKVLAFAASLRKDSLNRKLIRVAKESLTAIGGIDIDLADFRDFEMPMYDGDLEDREGLPKGAQEFVKRLRAADAVVISTPEYNGCIPGTLKNAIDWASRPSPHPFGKKPILLIGATPGGLGVVQCLWTTREPLEKLGAFVYPGMFGISFADRELDDVVGLKDPKQRARLDGVVQGFVEFVKKLKG